MYVFILLLSVLPTSGNSIAEDDDDDDDDDNKNDNNKCNT
jgi:hypothetical protein